MCNEARPRWFERPPQFVRDARGRVVDVLPRQMMRLCRAHQRAGDVEIVGKPSPGICGFSFNSPPPGGVIILKRKAKR